MDTYVHAARYALARLRDSLFRECRNDVVLKSLP